MACSQGFTPNSPSQQKAKRQQSNMIRTKRTRRFTPSLVTSKVALQPTVSTGRAPTYANALPKFAPSSSDAWGADKKRRMTVLKPPCTASCQIIMQITLYTTPRSVQSLPYKQTKSVHMPSHWYNRMSTSTHRRRTKHVQRWSLAKVLQSIVFPVGEEVEITFWVSWLRVSLPYSCLLIGLLSCGIWMYMGGTWHRSVDYKQTWWPVLVYTWDCLCGAEAYWCASFEWLVPAIALYFCMLAWLLFRIWM